MSGSASHKTPPDLPALRTARKNNSGTINTSAKNVTARQHRLAGCIVSQVRFGRPVKNLLSSVENPSPDLILLDGFKQGLEVTFTESFITLALN